MQICDVKICIIDSKKTDKIALAFLGLLGHYTLSSIQLVSFAFLEVAVSSVYVVVLFLAFLLCDGQIIDVENQRMCVQVCINIIGGHSKFLLTTDGNLKRLLKPYVRSG